MRLYIPIILLITTGIVIYFLAGHKTPTVESSLALSGDNRAELENVLIEYGIRPEDSLKLKAAEFLIRNMQDKYEAGKEDPCPCYDLQTLTGEDIKRNIEGTFEIWQKPWASHLTFDELCEYILPYRIGQFRPRNWRKVYSIHLSGFLSDSMQTAMNACICINNELINNPYQLTNICNSSDKEEQKDKGSCRCQENRNNPSLAVYAMRSLGIPVTVEFIPCMESHENGYAFNALYNTDKKYYDFICGTQNPCDSLSRLYGIPKIFRKTYAVQDNSLAVICGKEEIPDLFSDPCLLDVTNQYPFIQVQDISISLSSNRPKKQFVYLCIPCSKGLRPVAWGKVKRDKVTFYNIGSNAVYQVAYYNNNKFHPISDPYLLEPSGKMKKVKISTEQETQF